MPKTARGRSGVEGEGWLAALIVLIIAAFPIELGSESLTLQTYYPSPLGIYTNLTSTGQTLLARDGGQVGVGLSNPDTELTVLGNGTGRARIGAACGGNYTGIGFNGALPAGSCGNYNMLSSPSDQNLYLNRPSGYDINFRENNNGSPSQMTLKTGGDVYMGLGAWTSTIHIGGVLAEDGSDFKLGLNDGRAAGSNQRALVHDSSNVLKINYAGDFTGGVDVNGPSMTVDGTLTVSGNAYFNGSLYNLCHGQSYGAGSVTNCTNTNGSGSTMVLMATDAWGNYYGNVPISGGMLCCDISETP